MNTFILELDSISQPVNLFGPFNRKGAVEKVLSILKNRQVELPECKDDDLREAIELANGWQLPDDSALFIMIAEPH